MSDPVNAWLTGEAATECCAKCRRGTKELRGPCGYHGACPNPKCQHPRRNQ